MTYRYGSTDVLRDRVLAALDAWGAPLTADAIAAQLYVHWLDVVAALWRSIESGDVLQHVRHGRVDYERKM